MHLIVPFASAPVFSPDWAEVEVVLLQLGTVAFLVLLNGFFVASEFAIVKARGSQLDALAEKGDRRAERARKVTEHLDAYLSATQLGITLASLALGWVGEPFLARMLHPVFVQLGMTSEALIMSVSLTIAFALVTFLHIVLGELAPKSLAIRRSVETTLWVARPLGWFYVLFKPAIVFLNGTANLILKHVFKIAPVSESELAHDEEELRVILAESRDARTLSARGSDISMRAFELRRRTAREIVTPRQDVVFLTMDATFAENLKVAKASGHTRFPLCHSHLDEAVGLIHIKDLIISEGQAVPDLAKIKRDLISVPEMMSLESLLEVFQTKHAHLALVVDEFGGATGIVTLDNVIEELVGDIQDEFDAEQGPVEQKGPGEYVLSGTLNLHEVREATGLELESAESTTLGGYLTEQLARLPIRGDVVKIDEYEATVLDVVRRRVQRVLLRRLTPIEANGEAAD